MIEDQEKEGADSDNVGIGGDDSSVENVVEEMPIVEVL